MKQKLIDQATQCAIDAFFNELSENAGLELEDLSFDAVQNFDRAALEVVAELIDSNS